MPKAAHIIIAAGLVFAMYEGCKCDSNSGKTVPGICAKDTTCPKGQVYRKGVCALERCDNSAANPDGDCCPGQLCKNDGLCDDRRQVCTKDTDCGGSRSGRVCLAATSATADSSTDARACAFPSPDAKGACPDNYRPFNKRCIKDLPCEGGCDDTLLCNIQTNQCEKIPNIPTAGNNCQVSCATGTIKVLSDPDGMIYDSCCALACVCEALPPLSEGVYGRYASAAVRPAEILVASYNSTYKDLVLSHHDRVSGKKLNLEFVDGVPAASGALQGDPTGPRGGVSDPGPDVGMYASLAIGSDSQPRIAYYDATHFDLKYAEKTADGWAVHTVDSDGDVGQFASLAFIAGKLRIAYFVRSAKSATGSVGPYTTLRYAEAKSASPRGPADWTLVDAVTPAQVRNPCGGKCSSSEVCLYVPTPAPATKVCGKRDTACDATQPDNTICATPNGGSKAYYAEDAIPQVVELPSGIGLYPAMLQKDDKLLITYYDNYTPPAEAPPFTIKLGALKGIIAPLSQGVAGTFSAPVTLDDGEMCGLPARDVGRFAAPAIAANGSLGIAYVDKTRGELRYYQPQNASDTFVKVEGCFDPSKTVHASGRISIADSGVGSGSGGVSIVGADAFLHFDPSSRPAILYQDQSHQDVRVTTRRDGKWYVDYLSQDKGDGFEIQLLEEGSTDWLVSVAIGIDAIGQQIDHIIARPVTLPPH